MYKTQTPKQNVSVNVSSSSSSSSVAYTAKRTRIWKRMEWKGRKMSVHKPARAAYRAVDRELRVEGAAAAAAASPLYIRASARYAASTVDVVVVVVLAVDDDDAFALM